MIITYDTVNILTGNYKITTLGHDSSPENIINNLKPTREDGIVIISSNFGAKYIDIAGWLIGTTQANLETNIDSFKELISRKDKDLDISYAGGTRRYVCRSIICNVISNFYNLTFATYRVRFVVADGYGKDTSRTTAINQLNLTANDTQSYTFLGSYPAKPKHKISLDTRGNLDVVRIENDTTSEFMDIDWGNVSGDPAYVEIDEEALTVLDDSGNPVTYRGKFPSVSLGVSTTLKLFVYGSGSTLDQQQTDRTGGGRAVLGNVTTAPNQAQSFVPSQSGRIEKFTMYVDRTQNGGLGGNMQFLIYSDDNNKPGSNLFVGAGYEIAYASVPDSAAWTDAVWSGTDAQRPFLTANTRYWIFLNQGTMTGTDINNFYGWHYTTDGTQYASGKAMFQKSSSDDWQDGIANSTEADGGNVGQNDMAFKVYRGSDGDVPGWTISWLVDYVKKYL